MERKLIKVEIGGGHAKRSFEDDSRYKKTGSDWFGQGSEVCMWIDLIQA